MSKMGKRMQVIYSWEGNGHIEGRWIQDAHGRDFYELLTVLHGKNVAVLHLHRSHLDDLIHHMERPDYD